MQQFSCINPCSVSMESWRPVTRHYTDVFFEFQMYLLNLPLECSCIRPRQWILIGWQESRGPCISATGLGRPSSSQRVNEEYENRKAFLPAVAIFEIPTSSKCRATRCCSHFWPISLYFLIVWRVLDAIRLYFLRGREYKLTKFISASCCRKI